MERRNRIVIDTNLWVSFLLAKQFSFIDDLFVNGKIQLIFSQELLDDGLTKLKIADYG